MDSRDYFYKTSQLYEVEWVACQRHFDVSFHGVIWNKANKLYETDATHLRFPFLNRRYAWFQGVEVQRLHVMATRLHTFSWSYRLCYATCWSNSHRLWMAHLQTLFDGDNASNEWFPLRFKVKQMTLMACLWFSWTIRPEKTHKPCLAKNMGASSTGINALKSVTSKIQPFLGSPRSKVRVSNIFLETSSDKIESHLKSQLPVSWMMEPKHGFNLSPNKQNIKLVDIHTHTKWY